ncbi:MAG: M20/M25/M40 family metallo-hydrolase [Spirochaetes bacterium]|nr:M20/M25/M40 family metallo-hydrolase [Spirochaetota bacterium]
MYRINRTRLINTFLDLVKIPSPSWDEDRVLHYISRRLKKLGIRHRALRCGDSHNLLVSLKGTLKCPCILFSAHMDTVTPCDRVVPVVTHTKITSNGTTILGSDDKSAIAMFLEGLETLKENQIPHGDLEILFSCAEELGLQGIKRFNFSLLKSKYAFVFDSDGDVGGVIVKAPHHSRIDLEILGKAAHAGMEPEKGINAINVISEIITLIPSGRIDEETTVNVGTVTGGTATNIVAERAQCALEVRSIDRKKLTRYETIIKDVIKKTCVKRRAKFRIARTILYSGFTVRENDRVLRYVKKALERIGIEPVLKTSGGGSDTNIINGAGIKGVNLACGMRNVHSTSEYILIKDLVDGTNLMLSIIQSVGH